MNNIYTSFRKVLLGAVFITALALSSCVDELTQIEKPSYYAGDGTLTSFALDVRTPGMNVKTKAALSDEQENAVEDLYVLMFRLSSDSDTNPAVLDIKKYYTLEDLKSTSPEANHTSAGVVMMKNVPTGTYYIAAVANIKGSIDSRKLMDDLDAVKTLEDYKAVQVNLAEESNLSRSILPMSGWYMAAGNTDPNVAHNTPAPVVVSAGKLDGYIHLRRIDARVHFNITQQIEGVSSFRIKNWQIVNIPNSSRVVSNELPDLCTRYTSTIKNISGWTYTNGVGDIMNEYQLDFYMFENRGLSKHGISEYKSREEEVKDGSGLNPEIPEYVNAPENSAYVVLEAEFRQTLTEGSLSYERFSDVQYIIHLGYCDEQTVDGVTSKANDFNTERNIRYIYNVIIRGANEVVVEAKRESIDNNGTEGRVIDVKGGEIIDLDAHYGVFNIVLTPKELSESEFIMNTPNGSWSTVGRSIGDPGYPDPWTEDYQHLRFAYNAAGTEQLRAGTPITKLVSYSDTYDHDCPTGTVISTIPQSSHTLIPVHHEKKQIQDATHTVPLYDMRCFKEEYGTHFDTVRPMGITSETTENTQLVFTVFINELYYYYPGGVINKDEKYGEDGYVASNETTRDYTMWKNFVNMPEGRSFILMTNTQESTDGDSHYLTARYHIRQRCIETFFGEHILEGCSPTSPDLPSALGIEQINEHHWKNLAISNYNFNGVAETDGWGRTSKNLIGEQWSAHVDQYHVMGTYYSAGTGTGTPESMDTQYHSFRTLSAMEKFNTGSSNYKTFTSDTYNYEVVDAAMNRNRDLNRDGLITADEVRWFAPTASQYVLFATGAGALQTKLFEKNHFDPSQNYWRWDNGGKNYKLVYGNGNFHYAGLDYKYLVAEEGTSTGNSSAAYRTQYSGEIRCARYLGVPGGDDGYDGIVLPEPVTYNPTTRVFDTRGYDAQMRRFNTSRALNAHDNFDYGQQGSNSLADYFQMAQTNSFHTVHLYDEVVAMEGDDLQANLNTLIDNNYFCRDYYENEDQSDRGTWRMPNMVEIAMMTKYGGLTAGPDRTTDFNNPELISCTYWFRNQDVYNSGSTSFEGETATINGQRLWRHFLGAKREGNSNLLTMVHTSRLYNQSYWFNTRCVRDTDRDGNFVGQPEYGNPVNFIAGDFGCVYVGEDQANYTVSATMDASQVSSVSVKIDGYSASNTGSGTVQSSVSGADVDKAEVTAVWTIVTTSGKTLTYRRSYALPARYWMISRYGATNRYIYTDVNDNNRVTIDSPYSGDLNDKDAVFKWIITKNPTSNPVNESELEINQTYYLYNAGTGTYVDGGAANNRLTTGGTPAPFQLRKRSEAGREDYYGLFFTGKNQYMNGNGTTQITFWSGFDDGSTQLLSPVVLKGEMPLNFEFAENYVDTGTGYSVSVETESGVAVSSVTIGGITANVSGSDGHFTATVNGTISGGAIATVWNVTKGGRSYSRTHTYAKPVKYYVISSAASGHTTQYGYVVPETERTVADAAANSTAPSDLGENYRFIITKEKTDNPVNVSTLTTTDTYYFYSVALGKYLSGPRPVSSSGYSDSYLTFSESFTPYTFVLKQFGSAYSLNINNCSGHPNLCFASWGTTYDYSKLGIFETSNQNRDGFRFILTPVY